MHLRKVLIIVAGFLLSGLFLFLSVRRVDWFEVLDSITSAELFPWILLALLSYLIGHLLRGVRTRMLVSRHARISLLSATNVVVLGYAVNNILPARMGEFARAGMLSEQAGLSYTQSLTVTFLERILDGLALLGLLAATTLFIPSQGLVRDSLIFASIVFGAAVLIILLFVGFGDLATVLTSRVTSVVCPRWHHPALRFVSSITSGLSYIRSPRRALTALAISLAIWLFEAGMFGLLFLVFDLKIGIVPAVLIMAVTNFGILIPSSPGFIGTFHFFCIQALLVLGIGKESALSYATLVHLTFFLPITFWGLGIISRYSFKLGSIVKLMRRARSLDNLGGLDSYQARPVGSVSGGKRQTARPSRFIVRMTEALLPPDGVEPDDREAVLSDVAVFVQGQLEALPRRLKILYFIGMTGFRVFTAICYLRPFSGLALAKRVKLVEGWAYGRLGLARQLFRPVRSTALLAFYEHPRVG